MRSVNALAAAALLMLVFPACSNRSDPVQPTVEDPVSLSTATAEIEEVARRVHASGSVYPRVRVAPGTKILGRVRTAGADVGQTVERGQVLATLEDRDLSAAVDQASAAIVVAEAQRDNARSQHERLQLLHRRGSVTDKNLEDAVSAFRIAEASLLQAQANLAAAEATLAYATIRSPIRGYVTAKQIEAGDMARPGEPLFVVEDLSQVKVVVTVTESEVVGLAPGDPAQVEVAVLESSREAVVESVNPSGDPMSRTFEIRLLLDNADGRLKSGMYARASFDRGSREGLFVPSRAVVERGALTGLYVLDDEGRGRLRWIRTGEALDERVEVLSGLSPGERYVVAPPLGFTDGTPVLEG